MAHLVTFDRTLIAPCGINCGTCMAFLREKNKCFGCRVDFDSKRKTCLQCKISNCDQLAKSKYEFCSGCDLFPCGRIRHIDKRYKIKYKTSLIQNLVDIKENGIDSFLKKESAKWRCPKCGSTLSVHRVNCFFCSN